MADNIKRVKIRKHGNDFNQISAYNYVKVEGGTSVSGNGLFPEWAPSSIIGQEVIEGKVYDRVGHIKPQKGNCTWYALGRYMEVHQLFVPFPHLRRNANQWLSTGYKVSNTPEVGGIVVFEDGKYGHVAFIEKIENGKVIVSESSYSSKTANNWLFKYGRTADQICREWGMKIKGYIAPATMVDLYDEELNIISETGYEFETDRAINLRDYPNAETGKILGVAAKGARFKYTGKVDINGYRWIVGTYAGKTAYMAMREIKNGVPQAQWGKPIKSGTPAPAPAKPKPPVSNVGKYANLKGTVVIYKDSALKSKYPTPSGKNRSQQIKQETSNAYLIKWQVGGATQVWVPKNKVIVTDKALYKIQ